MRSALDIYAYALTRRNHVLGAALAKLVQRAARSLAAQYRRLEMGGRRRAAIRALNRLDDRLLADIGLSRSGIRDVVARQIARQAPSSARASLVRRAQQAFGGARRRFMIWHNTRKSLRQLRRLDRRQLADIGLQHGDLDWVARDHAERALTRAANDNPVRAAA